MAIRLIDNKLSVLTSRLTLVFCLIVFLAGLYQCYLYFIGDNYDLFGIVISLLLPFVVVNFIYPRKIEIKISSDLKIHISFLMREKILRFKTSEIKEVSLTRTRGGQSSRNYALKIAFHNDMHKSISLFSKFTSKKEREGVESFIRKINLSLR